MKPQEIDNSHAIFSKQKIREINYKFRKRKVDYDIEHGGHEDHINNQALM